VLSTSAEDGAGSSLHFAIRRNCVRLVSELLEQGASTSTVDGAGNQPLQAAGGQASYEICQLLVDFGADLEVQTKAGETALALASRLDFVLTARALIESGACVNCYDKDGWMPLHNAAFGGFSDLCDLLLSKNAEATALTRDETPECAASIARARNYQNLADMLELAMDTQTTLTIANAANVADFDQIVQNSPSDQFFLESLKIQHTLIADSRFSSNE